ncbi:Aste57867_13986 [Aphanomyces stellatus]|uniref:Aste57867_13986 protein n=1 Tax=Aphanomyces stellatus TaxID=120398 RepID=A0A485L1S2_9STRA|nr:hypothetical protein As57867_013935 [Aphanomyces stellatus]VFT90816.1 Aste57867_13986 [Aphanomyces stellatus]
MHKDTTKLLSATVGGLTVVQGVGTALGTSVRVVCYLMERSPFLIDATYGFLPSLFLGFNLVIVGAWLVVYEYNAGVSPVADLAKWTPFLESRVGKAYLFQFLAFLSVGSYFGALWNTFVFWWQLGVSAIFAWDHFTTSSPSFQATVDVNHESLLLHDYQKLDVQAM